jgi:hypothetical protein
MATWSDIGLVAVGGGIGLVSSYVTARLQMTHSTRERRAAAADARRERFASAIGRTNTLLVDLHPARVGFGNPERLQEQRERWLGLRDELSILGIGDPSPALTEAAFRLAVTIENLINGLAAMAYEGLQGEAAKRQLDEALRLQLVAIHVVAEIAHMLHGGEGNTRATRPAENGRDEATDTDAE